MSAEDAANGTFKNGLLPTVAFRSTAFSSLRRGRSSGVREVHIWRYERWEVPVLEQGITPETIGINPVDAQLLETREHGVIEICRWFGVPPWMIGQTDKGSNWGPGLNSRCSRS